MTVDELKQQIREKSKRLMSAVGALVSANGGKADELGYIQVQPFGLNALSSPVNLAVDFLSSGGAIPTIIVSSKGYSINEAEELSELLLKMINLIKQAEQQSGTSIREIVALESEFKDAWRKAWVEEEKKRAAEFAALPREELLWQKGNIQVVLKREGGEYSEKSARATGDIYLAVRKNGQEKNFYAGGYMTESGAFQRQKFIRCEQWLFEDYVEEVAEHIKEWHQRVNEEWEKYLR